MRYTNIRLPLPLLLPLPVVSKMVDCSTPTAVKHNSCRVFCRLKESVAVDTGILARFLGSHFRFSGRTQQQVKRDAMVIGRRPQLAAPPRRRPMPTRWTVPLPSAYNNHIEHNCTGQFIHVVSAVSHCGFQSFECVIVNVVKYLQYTFNFCLRTHVD